MEGLLNLWKCLRAKRARFFFSVKARYFFNLKPSWREECFCEVEGSKVDPRYACNKCCV